MKRILGIMGSPRRNGNTHVLISKILEGAREAGAHCEEIILSDLKIAECDGCNVCWKSGVCPQGDDMEGLYSRLPDFDCFVFGTPLYWYGPTALMKAFWDRLYYYCGGEQRGKIEGREAALVVVFEEEDPQAANATLEMFQRSFEYLKWRLRHRLIVPGVGAKGEIWKKAKEMEEAYTLGQDLAR